MSWFNKDGLLLKYGREKAVPATAGDFLSYGEDRTIEIDIDVATLTTSAVIKDDMTLVPAGVIIDEVIVIATTVVTDITSLSIGTVKQDRTTGISETALVAALPIANLDTAGETTRLTGGVTYAGAKVGISSGADAGYITAKVAGTLGTGKVKVRIKYRGVPPITQ